MPSDTHTSANSTRRSSSKDIAASRTELAELIGSRVTLLAVRYGDHDQRTVISCRDAGYERVSRSILGPTRAKQPATTATATITVSVDGRSTSTMIAIAAGSPLMQPPAPLIPQAIL
jgi:hypothetical protein